MNQVHDPLDVSVVTPQKILFQGKAESVIFPGEKGVFEVIQHHKPILTRLIRGEVLIDGHPIRIQRGVVKVAMNAISAIVETGSRDES